MHAEIDVDGVVRCGMRRDSVMATERPFGRCLTRGVAASGNCSLHAATMQEAEGI